MLDQVVSARETVVILPQAVFHGTILLHWEMNACLVALEIRGSREGLAAADAGKGSTWLSGHC